VYGDGRLTASYRKPFDLIAETAVKAANLAQTEPFTVVNGVVSDKWRAIVDIFRTLGQEPPTSVTATLELTPTVP